MKIKDILYNNQTECAVNRDPHLAHTKMKKRKKQQQQQQIYEVLLCDAKQHICGK